MHLSPDMWGPQNPVEVVAMGERPFKERLSTRFFNWVRTLEAEDKVMAALMGTGMMVLGTSAIVAVGMLTDMALGEAHPTVAEVVSTQHIPAHTTIVMITQTVPTTNGGTQIIQTPTTQ